MPPGVWGGEERPSKTGSRPEKGVSGPVIFVGGVKNMREKMGGFLVLRDSSTGGGCVACESKTEKKKVRERSNDEEFTETSDNAGDLTTGPVRGTKKGGLEAQGGIGQRLLQKKPGGGASSRRTKRGYKKKKEGDEEHRIPYYKKEETFWAPT